MHIVVICQYQRPDASARQVQRSRCTQPAQTDNQHLAVEQFLLPVQSDIVEQDLA